MERIENPFLQKFFCPPPQSPRSMPEVPVQRRKMPVRPKVVPNPVRSVGLDKIKSDSAMKIQKVCRGFLVRESVKKVVRIKREVDEIEGRLAKRETVELIWNDAKERLKVGETLMGFLFRLDSVIGVDSGIRDLRKAVIKKAIALQEKVDSVVSGDEAIGVVDETLGAEDATSLPNSIGNGGALIAESLPSSSELKVAAVVSPAGDHAQILQDHGVNSPCQIAVEESTETEAVELKMPEEVEDRDIAHCVNERAEQCTETSEAESLIDSSSDPQSSVKGAAENAAMEARECDGNEGDRVELVGEDSRVKGRKEDKQNTELLEKMVVDNKKIMETMVELLERNENQTRLISSLSQRVERLEKTFVREKQKMEAYSWRLPRKMPKNRGIRQMKTMVLLML